MTDGNVHLFFRAHWKSPFTAWMAGKCPGPRFNIKMTSYQYRKSHCGDKTILRLSYLHNGISYTGKTTSLYWIGAQKAVQGDCKTVYHLAEFISPHPGRQGGWMDKSKPGTSLNSTFRPWRSFKNYLFNPKLQWLHHLGMGMDKSFHPILYTGCHYLSMLV